MKRLIYKDLISLFAILLSVICFFPLFANASEPDYEALAEERKKLTIESNLYDNWPAGPELGAESAILIDANTGIVLYEKNIHAKLYPASITKILTALVAYDNCDMKEMVTFSYDAVNSIDWRYDANMGITGGSSITMEETLYGMLVGSANEAAIAIAEHVSGKGNLKDFAKLMNEKAVSLGCTDSNFVTPNGIHDDNHYTTASDLTKIMAMACENETFCKLIHTPTHYFGRTNVHKEDGWSIVTNSNKILIDPWLIAKTSEGYDTHAVCMVGGKTGSTSMAGTGMTTYSVNENGHELFIAVCGIPMELYSYQTRYVASVVASKRSVSGFLYS